MPNALATLFALSCRALSEALAVAITVCDSLSWSGTQATTLAPTKKSSLPLPTALAVAVTAAEPLAESSAPASAAS